MSKNDQQAQSPDDLPSFQAHCYLRAGDLNRMVHELRELRRRVKTLEQKLAEEQPATQPILAEPAPMSGAVTLAVEEQLAGWSCEPVHEADRSGNLARISPLRRPTAAYHRPSFAKFEAEKWEGRDPTKRQTVPAGLLAAPPSEECDLELLLLLQLPAARADTPRLSVVVHGTEGAIVGRAGIEVAGSDADNRYIAVRVGWTGCAKEIEVQGLNIIGVGHRQRG